MSNIKKGSFLLIVLSISLFCLFLLSEMQFTIADSFNKISFDLYFVFFLNFLAVHCVLNTHENISVYLFGLLLFWFGWIFEFSWFSPPIFTELRYFLMFFFSLLLVAFYISLFEDIRSKNVIKLMIIQGILSIACLIFYGRFADHVNAFLFFINIVGAIALCIYYSYKHLLDQTSKRLVSLIIAGLLCSVLPYLLLTFVPTFLLTSFNLPTIGNWTLYFLLILPIVFSVILNKRNLSIEQIGIFRYPVNLLILTVGIASLNLLAVFILEIPVLSVIIMNYFFVILYVIYYAIAANNVKIRQEKLKKVLNNFQEERLDIFRQLFADDQLEKIGILMLDLVKSSIPFTGGAITIAKNRKNEVYIVRSGDLEDLTLGNIEGKAGYVHELKTFPFKNVNCISLPLNYLNDRIGSITLSRASFSFFTSEELEVLEKYTQILSEMLVTSLRMAEYERNSVKTGFTAEERLIYLKTADLAEQDKKRLATYLHDEILQKIFGIKNLLSTLQGPDETKRLMMDTLEEINVSLRKRMTEMYPAFLNVTTLEEAIMNLVEKSNQFYHKNIQMDLLVEPNLQLGQKQRHMIFRMVKELIINVYKHAGATSIVVEILKDKEMIDITVQDNGVGINQTTFQLIDVLQNHLGLASIKQEVFFLNGFFEIKNLKNQGLGIEISIPYISEE